MLTYCKATERKLIYGCTFKSDLIAQHPKLVDLSGKKVWFWGPFSGLSLLQWSSKLGGDHNWSFSS